MNYYFWWNLGLFVFLRALRGEKNQKNGAIYRSLRAKLSAAY